MFVVPSLSPHAGCCRISCRDGFFRSLARPSIAGSSGSKSCSMAASSHGDTPRSSPQKRRRRQTRFPPRPPGSQSLRATRHPRTDAPVRLTRASRTLPSPLSRYARCAGSPERSPRRRAFFPASALHHSAPAAVPARSRRRVPAARRHAHRENLSCVNPHLEPLVGGSAVLVNHPKLVGEAEKALRMAHEQISAGIQATEKLLDQRLLSGFVEVHHHVTADIPSSDYENRSAPSLSAAS